MPLEYYYNGHLRWSLFWENPNYTAAFLACSLAWLWWLGFLCKDKIRQRVVLIAAFGTLCAIELVLWFLLAKTYSRGGLVAAVAGMLFFFVLRGLSGTGWRSMLLGIIPRIAIIAVTCTAVGFSSRMSPAYVAQDNSVLNRLELWKGAIVMMHDAPFNGWGKGMGGVAYANWYQPLEATVRPISFVNSYLEVAVECGTHVLFVALIYALALVLFAALHWTRRVWVLAGGSVLVVWFTANLLTSLWAEPTLWIIPAIAASCVIASSLSAKKTWLPVLAISATASLAICGLLVFAGGVMSKTHDYSAKPLKQSDAVLVASRNNKNAGQPLCEIWMDSAVFGRFWGRTIRTILDESTVSRLLVYAPWASEETHLGNGESPKLSVYSGFQVDAINKSRQSARKTIILHPIGFPPAEDAISRMKTIVCLPTVDTSTSSLSWRVWGGKHADRGVIHSPQGGSRIMPSSNLPFWRSLFSDG